MWRARGPTTRAGWTVWFGVPFPPHPLFPIIYSLHGCRVNPVFSIAHCKSRFIISMVFYHKYKTIRASLL